eukprot:1504418-Rhodomonas_salina.1
MVETEADRQFRVNDHESEPCSPSEDGDDLESSEDGDEARDVLDSATADLVGPEERTEINPYEDVVVISSDEE